MDLNMKLKSVYGSTLKSNPLVRTNNPFISIPGHFDNHETPLQINKETLSRHMILLGGTGCGKSNVFYHMVSQIKQKLSSNDVMIIFDTKGDYYHHFAEPRDVVIGGGKGFSGISEKWNIFKELTADGWDARSLELNTQELSWAIFRKAINKSKDPFFPNAARDLFAAILFCMLKESLTDPSYKKKYLFNSELKAAINESSIFDVKEMLEVYPECVSVLSYIGDGTTGQALGVYAEMLGTVRQLLSSCFEERGMFSIRDFVRDRGGKVLFIEYDISIGETLSPIYSLLFDLALKEALGRGKSQGDVYFICDEFRLLPYLRHIDDGVNFGRSLGVKVIAGLQNINQLTETYGEYRGKNIIAGFSSVFAFKANDVFTRDYVIGLHGKNVVIEQHQTLSASYHEERRGAHVVEDWDMNELSIGEAIISFPFSKPFKYKFDLFQKK